MRLIDANSLKLKKVYCQERHEWVVPVAEIDWTPTAFDLGRVMEELNEEQETWLRGYNQTLSMGLEHLWRNLSGRAFGVARAIEIVRKGGADD